MPSFQSPVYYEQVTIFDYRSQHRQPCNVRINHQWRLTSKWGEDSPMM